MSEIERRHFVEDIGVFTLEGSVPIIGRTSRRDLITCSAFPVIRDAEDAAKPARSAGCHFVVVHHGKLAGVEWPVSCIWRNLRAFDGQRAGYSRPRIEEQRVNKHSVGGWLERQVNHA